MMRQRRGVGFSGEGDSPSAISLTSSGIESIPGSFATEDTISFTPSAFIGGPHFGVQRLQEGHELSEECEILDEVFRRAFSCVVRDAMDQLGLLVCIYKRFVGGAPEENLNYRTLEQRFGAGAHEGFVDYKLNALQGDYQKLLRDIGAVVLVTEKLANELVKHGTFTNLTDYVESFGMMKQDEDYLIKDLIRKRRKQRILRRAARSERRQNMQAINELRNYVSQLKVEYEDKLVYHTQEYIFLERWEVSRQEQNSLVQSGKENAYMFTIKNTKRDIEIENRCHDEIRNFIEELRQDYLEQIQYWMDHYEEEIEKKDNQIFKMKISIDEVVKNRTELEEEYSTRQQQMKEWLAYKKAKKAREDREALELWAATKIQAWWKGVMFRRKIGPYKRKKDKGKKGKDKQSKKRKL